MCQINKFNTCFIRKNAENIFWQLFSCTQEALVYKVCIQLYQNIGENIVYIRTWISEKTF